MRAHGSESESQSGGEFHGGFLRTSWQQLLQAESFVKKARTSMFTVLFISHSHPAYTGLHRMRLTEDSSKCS